MTHEQSFTPEPWSRWLQRLWRQQWLSDRAALQAVPDALAQQITRRVRASETRHSGQVRVCVEGALPLSDLWRAGRRVPLSGVVRQRALAWFSRLQVWDTAHNNGVLIYLLLAERRIEIVADRGLHACASAQDWQAIVARLSSHLQRGDVEAGLTQALEEVSALLVSHFPVEAGSTHPNELPDMIVRV